MELPKKLITPIFVLGSPRSGTTLIGSYISSNPIILDMGEYAGFDFTHRVAVDEMIRLPSVFKNEYLREIQAHAYDFAVRRSVENGCSHFCDSTPWTLLGVKEITERYPHAKFVLCIRSPEGVIQSLERSYKDGYKWAGANNEERFELWKKFYSNISFLSNENTIIFNYSDFCKKPKEEPSKLNTQLLTFGFDVEKFDVRKFTISYATKKENQRPTSALFNERTSEITLVEREDFNHNNFTQVEKLTFRSDPIYKKIAEEFFKKFGIQL